MNTRESLDKAIIEVENASPDAEIKGRTLILTLILDKLFLEVLFIEYCSYVISSLGCRTDYIVLMSLPSFDNSVDLISCEYLMLFIVSHLRQCSLKIELYFISHCYY